MSRRFINYSTHEYIRASTCLSIDQSILPNYQLFVNHRLVDKHYHTLINLSVNLKFVSKSTNRSGGLRPLKWTFGDDGIQMSTLPKSVLWVIQMHKHISETGYSNEFISEFNRK